MRKVAFFLLLGCATLGHGIAATAAETWKWKDANGVVHYSDQPAPGAERMQVVVAKPSAPAPKQATAQAAPRATAAASADSSPPANVPYTRCVITAPDSEETFNATTSVTVGLLVEPALQTGHHIEVLLDGNAVPDWPPTAVSHPVKDLERGAHSVSARVLDASGGTACSGPTLNFHVRLPTVKPQVMHH